MKVVVLAGGLSLERNVSLTSGAMVSRALREAGYQVALRDLYFDTTESFDFLSQQEIPEEFFSVNTEIPDLEVLSSQKESNSFIGEGVLSLCKEADITFLALHGACGEDGRLQAVLELEGIPYTGSNYFASAIAMDKDLTKRLICDKIPTASWRKVRVTSENIFQLMEETVLPVVVKPLDCGSSIGVSIAKTAVELKSALESALSLGGMTVIEEFIQGREIQVAVLGDKVLPSIEIIVENGFYDIENKYKAGKASEICPAPIDTVVEEKLGQYTKIAFDTLGLSVIARADFIVTEEGIPYFLEINTLPGMTSTSLVPQEAAAVGLSYGELCETIVGLSLKK